MASNHYSVDTDFTFQIKKRSYGSVSHRPRIHAGNWFKQSAAGMDERPQASPASGFDTYLWIKPSGESDDSFSLIPNDDGKGFDRMCDSTHGDKEPNGN